MTVGDLVKDKAKFLGCKERIFWLDLNREFIRMKGMLFMILHIQTNLPRR